MKKITASALTLLLIFFLCLYSVNRVDRICRETSNLLRQAETQCILGNYEGAKEIIRLSQAHWEKHEAFLGIALRHTESDDIEILYPPLLESCSKENAGDFLLRNLELIATLKQLSHMEKAFLFNIL